MGFVGWKGVWINDTQVASKPIIYKRGWLPGVLVDSDFGSSSPKRANGEEQCLFPLPCKSAWPLFQDSKHDSGSPMDLKFISALQISLLSFPPRVLSIGYVTVFVPPCPQCPLYIYYYCKVEKSWLLGCNPAFTSDRKWAHDILKFFLVISWFNNKRNKNKVLIYFLYGII